MRKIILATAVAISLVAAAVPAQADKQVVSDPNDTRGKLDIRRAVLSHRGTGGNMDLIFKLGTYDEWAKRDVAGRRGSIVFFIRRSPESSWRLEIKRYPGGNFAATLVMCIEAQGCDFENGGAYDASRPNRKSAKVRVPKSDLGGVGNVVRWVATTAFGRGCDGNCFFDRAPNQGLARHEL
jgi:hypothetical protein